MNRKNILLIGRGFLGEYIVQKSKDLEYEITSTNFTKNNNKHSKNLDITKIEQLENLIKRVNPDYLINCAARGDIDFLEQHPDLANKINCEGAANVAKISEENKIRLIHISTDSVFDGKKGQYSENDKPNPLNVYAKSKYAGELKIEKNSKDYVIIRTNFYGLNERKKYFFNWILKNLKSQNKIIGFTDVIFSHLDVISLSKMILELLTLEFRGILHLSSGKTISKYDFILEVVKIFSSSKDLVHPGSITEQKFVAIRPKNTSLKNNLAKRLLKTSIIDLETWLTQNKSEIWKYLK